MGKNIALIVAAGRGHRMGGAIPKQYRELGGIPVLRHTAAAFCRHPDISEVQVLIHPSDVDLYDAATEGMQLLPPLLGGNSRQESVHLGLEGIAERGPEKVVIHDAVRPFVARETITGVLEALERVPCAVAGLLVVDTLKRCEQSRIVGTVDRTGVHRAQTPQAFRFQDILQAHRKLRADHSLALELTDDAMVAELVGMPIEMVLGTDDNFKLTTEVDLTRAEAIFQRGHQETHTGWGFDSQTLRAGDHAVICGIPLRLADGMKTKGTIDIALNAVARALLGTVGGVRQENNLGKNFTNRSIANSETLIRDAVSLVAMEGGRIEHIDLTLINDDEEIFGDFNEMLLRMAALLSIPHHRVSLKHIHTEDMGFAFRRDTLAAQCVATVNYPPDLPD